ncbi:hypothetical protein ACFVW1_39295 [Streptomyces olivochromogenes]|uniref:hypothetical protein n=1 Tax=Streptomyces olivochromogenes TaxID=1963 RepID=UPI0036D8F42D
MTRAAFLISILQGVPDLEAEQAKGQAKNVGPGKDFMSHLLVLTLLAALVAIAAITVDFLAIDRAAGPRPADLAAHRHLKQLAPHSSPAVSNAMAGPHWRSSQA